MERMAGCRTASWTPSCPWPRSARRDGRTGKEVAVTTGYLPIVILAGLAGAFAVLSLAASALVRPSRPSPAKLAPYECGIEPVRLPKSERFPVKFYVV